MTKALFLLAASFFLMPMWAFSTESSKQKEGTMEKTSPAIQEAIQEMIGAWNEFMTAPISMDMETFERRIREEKENTGINFDDEWIDSVKRMLRDPTTPQKIKNFILAEARPPELENALKRYEHALGKLLTLAPGGSAQAVRKLLQDEGVDETLKHVLKESILPALEAAK